jgi:hypothetical protein
MERDEEIRLLAYKIWEEKGYQDGHDSEHWFRAEAIWEKKQKDAMNDAQIKANQTVKQNATFIPSKKKSRRT